MTDTTHGHHIPGTPEVPSQWSPGSCGGIGGCYECNIEAGAAMPAVVAALEERVREIENRLSGRRYSTPDAVCRTKGCENKQPGHTVCYRNTL